MSEFSPSQPRCSSQEKIKKPSVDQAEKQPKLDDRSSKTSNATKHQDKITLGICAMKKKVQSKPMKEILSRLACEEIQILEMWEYLEESFQTWPKVEALICFHSDGFPYVQAWRYVKKNKPFLINNLDKQQLLWDRSAVYDILKKIRVPVAKHFMVFKDMNYLTQIQMRGNATLFGEQDDEQSREVSNIQFNKKSTVSRDQQQKGSSEAKNNQSQITKQLELNKSSQVQKKQQSQQRKSAQQKEQSPSCSPLTSPKQVTISLAQILQQNPPLIQSTTLTQPQPQNIKQTSPSPPAQSKIFYQQQVSNNRRSRVQALTPQKNNKSTSLNKRNSSQQNSQRMSRHASLLFDQDDHLAEDMKSRKSNEDSVSVKQSLPFIRRQTKNIGMKDTAYSFPTALRDFHEKRLDNLENYTVEEIDDALLIKSVKSDKQIKMKKPFVEKPFDSENHNICIYYPESMGGGRKMLFRKVKNACSQYQVNQSNIRTDGNYIYEQYLPTNAFDIKVYTIGPYYMYAEARRSPTLDGVVERDNHGKQKRFPVILTPEQKFLCSKIVQQFQQEVCGFDLLRAEGKSYVCDVNGWSFVKGNPKYWDDCAIILRRKIFKKFFPSLLNSENSKYERFSNFTQNEYRPPIDRLNSKNQELRSIVSIFRHGDRSPKLKMKIKTKDKRFLQFFKDSKKDQVKLKDAKSLTKILNITNQIIVEIGDITKTQFKDFSQMKSVLESGGRFQGFNRKLQMKVIQRQTQANQQGIFPVKKILMVLKWGGQLSFIGYNDALDLGQKMRQERYDDDHDFLSLYSSYKHDLKTYSSDEGRCIKTAAAFLKGFLNISGGLAPIITSMINFTKKAQSLLDCTSQQNHSELSDNIKQKLSNMLNSQEQLMKNVMEVVKPEQLNTQMIRVIKEIGHGKKKLEKVKNLITDLVDILQELQFDNWHVQNQNNVQSHQEQDPQALIIIYKRWSKLHKDFYDPQKDRYNISKIPQIFDNIRYDLRKNHIIFNELDFKVDDLYDLAKLLAYFVVPNQYGMNDKEKLKTAKDIVSPLLEKILVDLMFWKNKKYQDLFWKYKQTTEQDNWKHIRTRLYFTSASHMYSILNIICLGNDRQLPKGTPKEQAQKAINQLYMSYLSHIEFRMYQNMRAAENDDDRFRLQVSISSEYKKDQKLKEFFLGGSHGFSINAIQSFFENILSEKEKCTEAYKKVNQQVEQSIF